MAARSKGAPPVLNAPCSRSEGQASARNARNSFAHFGGLCRMYAQLRAFRGGSGFVEKIFSRGAKIVENFVFENYVFYAEKVSNFCRIREYSRSSHLTTIFYADFTCLKSFSIVLRILWCLLLMNCARNSCAIRGSWRAISKRNSSGVNTQFWLRPTWAQCTEQSCVHSVTSNTTRAPG